MRILLLGTAAIALSGCSWLGLGGNAKYGNDIGTYKAQHGGAYAAQGSDCCPLSRWNVEGGIGTDIITGPSFINQSDANAIAGTTVNTRSNRTAFDEGLRYDIGGSYALNPNRKLTVTGYKTEAKGNRISLGRENGGVVAGDVDDYQAYGLELGLRQYSMPIKAPLVKSVRPYIEGRIGAANVDDIGLTNVTRGGVAGTDVGLYEGGWVPTGAGLIGVETPVFDRFTMGVETGIRYNAKLDSDTSTLGAGAAFAGANSGGDVWSIPLTLRGRYRF